MLTFNRLNFKLVIGGFLVVILNTLVFHHNGLDLSKIFVTTILPSLIIAGISFYFYYEKLFIHSTHLEYRSLLKKVQINYQDIHSINLKVEVLRGDDNRSYKYYMVFVDYEGRVIDEISFGFLKNTEDRHSALTMITLSNPHIQIDDRIIYFN